MVIVIIVILMKKNQSLIDNGPCKWSHIHSSFAVPNISTEMGTECLQQRLEGSLQCKKTKSNLRPMITRCGKGHDSKQCGCPGKTVTSTVYSILYHWIHIHIYIYIPSLIIMFWKVSQMVSGHHWPLQCNGHDDDAHFTLFASFASHHMAPLFLRELSVKHWNRLEGRLTQQSVLLGPFLAGHLVQPLSPTWESLRMLGVLVNMGYEPVQYDIGWHMTWFYNITLKMFRTTNSQCNR